MYNNDNLWLFKAMQGYHTEKLAEEERRHHPAAGAQAPKFQERLLENMGDRLVSLGLKLKARPQPET